MDKLNNIDELKLHVLIEIKGDFNEETTSGIIIGNEATKYNKDAHAVRNGVLTKMPHWINWEAMKWKTDYFPKVGDKVIFDFVDASSDNAMRVTHGGKIYIILPYTSLIMAFNDKGYVRMLNGFLLAQKVLKRAKGVYKGIEVTKDEYYDDIYHIKYDGKPNISYKEQGMMSGETRAYVDDPSIVAGDKMYMTRASSFPVLEDPLHWKFSEKTYYVMQRKDIIAEVIEL